MTDGPKGDLNFYRKLEAAKLFDELDPLMDLPAGSPRRIVGHLVTRKDDDGEAAEALFVELFLDVPIKGSCRVPFVQVSKGQRRGGEYAIVGFLRLPVRDLENLLPVLFEAAARAER